MPIHVLIKQSMWNVVGIMAHMRDPPRTHNNTEPICMQAPGPSMSRSALHIGSKGGHMTLAQERDPAYL
jgi:hypothetical protein